MSALLRVINLAPGKWEAVVISSVSLVDHHIPCGATRLTRKVEVRAQMWNVIGWSTLALLVGFALGRIRPKIYARSARRLFRGIRTEKRPYAVPTDAAITYLIEIEKQEIESRQTTLKQMATFNAAALAISGALVVKHMMAFHMIAIMFYIIAFVSILAGHLAIGDYRKKRFNCILTAFRQKQNGQVQIPTTNVGSPPFARIAISVTYLAFLAGVLLTVYSFTAKSYCKTTTGTSSITRDVICDLALISEYMDEESKHSTPSP